MKPLHLSRRTFLKLAGGVASGLAGGFSVTPIFHTLAQGVNAGNPYLEGNFAPVFEEITADNLPIIGQLPAELSGMFVRNGSNPQFPPKGRYHWFDGDGMLHGVRLKAGVASYRNRYVRTRGFEIERREGHAIWAGLAEMPPVFNPPHGMMFKNAANTALVWHAGKLLALWEQGEPHQIAVPGLETTGPQTFSGRLKGAFTAHPKIDAASGEMMFFGYSPTGPDYLSYSVVAAQGEILRTVPLSIPRPVMMHDFAITANYTIFMDLPLLFDISQLFNGQPPARFDDKLPARFGILPRHGDNSALRWFEAPPCYIFHTLNAYESGDEVILVACRMGRGSIAIPPGHSITTPGHTSNVERSDYLGQSASHLYRWSFNLKTGSVQQEQLDETNTEFPRLRENLLGRPARYGYTGRMFISERGGMLFDGLMKYDLLAGRSDFHAFGPNRYGGEAVFVARSGSTVEHEGWLVTFVYDQAENTSELIVVDAQHMAEPPLARIKLPRRVPFGFHGIWLDESALSV